MYTITKRFDRLKAAHRQWLHSGHCSRVHGECWTIDVQFKAAVLDSNGFVVDFGTFRELRSQLDALFDHVLLIDTDDPEMLFFKEMDKKRLTKLVVLPSCSAEGIAKFVYSLASVFAEKIAKGRVSVGCVTVFEDNKNSATYSE